MGLFREPFLTVRWVLLMVGLFLLSPAWSQYTLGGGTGTNTHGFVNTVYQSRWQDGKSDQDFYQFWDVETEELVPGHARGAFSLRLNADVDGSVDSAPGLGTYIYDLDPFYSVDDAREDEFADVYTGFVDLYDLSPENGYLRIGRQYLPEFDYIHADAVTLKLPVTEWAKFTAFAGQAVSLYSGNDGDYTHGLALELQQSPGSRWLFEYHRYEDDFAGNDSYKAETWQKMWEGAFFHARFRGMDEKARDLSLNISQYFSPWDLTLFMDYRRQFTELDSESLQDSPLYYSGLCDWQPYNSFAIRFDKALPWNMGISGGFDIQRVSDDEESYGNENFDHGDLTLSFYPWDKWFYSISGEWWNTDPQSSFLGCSGEIGYRPSKCWDWTLGSSYGNYVFRYVDPQFGGYYREDPFIKTYYASMRWRISDTDNLRVNFEIEDDDRDVDYYTLRCTWGKTF